MGVPVTWSRRAALSATASTLVTLAMLGRVSAAPRPLYGGKLRVSVPLSLTRLDPHAADDLLAALIGSAFFEPLYWLGPGGVRVPALAAELPKRRRESLLVELRPGLTSSRGAPLDSGAVAWSLARSARMNGTTGELGRITTPTKTTIEFRTTTSESRLFDLLSDPRSLVVPERFDPARPDTTGSLAFTEPGLGRARRNDRAPRGGAFLDEVLFTRRDPGGCLRDFEANQSDLCLFGRGLYRGRSDAVDLPVPSLGAVVLLPGSGLARFASRGVLQAVIDGGVVGRESGRASLEALGIARRTSESERYRGPGFRILVSDEADWLVFIAKEISRNLSEAGSVVELELVSRDAFRERTRRRDHDVALTFVRARSHSHDSVAELFALDGTAPPRGRLPASLAEAGRSLRLGVVGELSPQLSLRTRFAAASGGLDLANLSRSPDCERDCAP